MLSVVLLLFSLALGAADVSPAALWRWLRGDLTAGPIRNILLYVRFPRVFGAYLCGSCLAVAGLLLQTVLHNPLASAGIIGVNAGAGFGAVLAAVLLPGIVSARPLLAFCFALGAALLVTLLSQRSGVGRNSIILAGVAMGSMLAALTDGLVTFFPDSVVDRSSYFIGGLAHVTLPLFLSVLPIMLLGLSAVFFLPARLNVLMLGDEVARSLGLAVSTWRNLAIALAALLAAAAVSLSGLIGFVGLIVPHLIRHMFGTDLRRILPLTLLGGGLLVGGCDLLARLIFAPFELPVGIPLALLGAPFFLWLILSRRRVRT